MNGSGLRQAPGACCGTCWGNAVAGKAEVATHVVDKRICRSCDAAIGGVCAGLAERYELDPIVVRILAVLIALLTAGLGVIAYIVLWVRLPRAPESDAPYEIRPESAESSAFGSVDCETGRAANRSRSKQGGISFMARFAIAAGLMLLFLAVAVGLSPLLPGTEWWEFWPLALVISGLCLIVIPIPTSFEAAWHALGIVVVSVAVMLLPMSLGVLSWETIPYAFSQAWLFLLVGLFMFSFGAYRGNDALIIASAFLVIAFCVYAITMCGVAGNAGGLVVSMLDGRSFRLALLGF